MIITFSFYFSFFSFFHLLFTYSMPEKQAVTMMIIIVFSFFSFFFFLCSLRCFVLIVLTLDHTTA